MKEITTFYLEMNSADELVEKKESSGLAVIEAKIDEYRLNKLLYQLVGEKWQWQSKLSISDKAWKEYVESPNLQTWVAYFKGSIAGYFELNLNLNGNTEIVYFGLVPKFIGKGFGGYLLSQAVKNAWSNPITKRVLVHTCTLDHQHALLNYTSRGFKVYKKEIKGVQYSSK